VNDVDQDAVTFSWTHSGGMTLPPIPNPCVSNLGPGTHTFTVTVDDRQGHTATDSVTYTVPGEPSAPVITVTAPSAGEVLDAGVPNTVRWTADRDALEWFLWYSGDGGQNWSRMWECMYLTPGARSCTWHSPWPPGTRVRVRVVANPDEGPTGIGESANFTVADRGAGGLPAYWDSRDIGAVGAAGRARYDQGTWTVRGSGADVWGTADEFHFVSYRDAGEITARIASVQNVNRWTKVGLMVRSAAGGAGAAHASIFVTPTVEKGIAFQRRTTANGPSVSTAGPAITAPVWLKLVQDDNVVSAYYRTNVTDAWTLVGSQTMPQNFFGELGLVVSSHVDGTLATATFDNVTTSVPRGLTSTDIGAVGVPGRTSVDGVTVTMEGSGTDIWGTADAFRFAYSQFHETVAVTARVRSIENTHVWAKAGVMIRADTSPGSPFVMVIVSPGKGVAMQYRRTRNGVSESAQFAGAAPRWVRLTRDGEWLVGWVSSNGTTWSEIARVSIPEIDHESLAGLAVTSHNNGTLATAVFDDIRFDRPNGY
jgi:hypothetical protein